jgi:hypothetical protein
MARSDKYQAEIEQVFAFAKYPDDQIRGQVMRQMGHTGQASQIGSAAQQ